MPTKTRIMSYSTKYFGKETRGWKDANPERNEPALGRAPPGSKAGPGTSGGRGHGYGEQL